LNLRLIILSDLGISTADRSAIEAVIQLQAHLDPDSGIDKTYRRNAELAFLEATFTFSWNDHDEPPRDDAFPGCSSRVIELYKYTSRFSHMVSTFADVKKYVEMLSTADHTRLISLLQRFSESNQVKHVSPKFK